MPASAAAAVSDWIILKYIVTLGSGGARYPSVTMYSNGTQSASDAAGRCGCSLTFSRHFYHPQRSCEGYVFTGICLSKGGRVCLSAWWDTTPREQTPPEADTPPRDTATAADSTHPTGMHSCQDKVWLEAKSLTL